MPPPPRPLRRPFGATHVHRVLRQVHPHLTISRLAMACVCDVIDDLGRRIVDVARELVLRRGAASTLQPADLLAAVRLVLTTELARHAAAEGSKVLPWNKRRTTRLQKLSGLVFPVGRTGRFLREQRVARRVSRRAPMFLAAVLEYVCAEVLELAGNVARDNRRKCVLPRHVFLGLACDEELDRVVLRRGVAGAAVARDQGAVRSGGALPDITVVLTSKGV